VRRSYTSCTARAAISQISAATSRCRGSLRSAEYLEAAMNAYRHYARTSGDTLMAAALYGTTDADVKALAHFLARQKP
jgi:cytochrome c553